MLGKHVKLLFQENNPKLLIPILNRDIVRLQQGSVADTWLAGPMFYLMNV